MVTAAPTTESVLADVAEVATALTPTQLAEFVEELLATIEEATTGQSEATDSAEATR